MQQIEDSPMEHEAQGPAGLSFFAQSQKTTRWSHSPMVFAMIKGSRMDNCDDVEAVLRECQATNSKDTICQTAQTVYFSKCIQK